MEPCLMPDVRFVLYRMYLKFVESIYLECLKERMMSDIKFEAVARWATTVHIIQAWRAYHTPPPYTHTHTHARVRAPSNGDRDAITRENRNGLNWAKVLVGRTGKTPVG